MLLCVGRSVFDGLGLGLGGAAVIDGLGVGVDVVRALADIRRGCHDGFLGAQRRRGRESVDLLRVAAGEDLDACRAEQHAAREALKLLGVIKEK